MPERDDLLVWIDLEMTSLVDPSVDSITQIACVITDKDLNTVAESDEITIHADQERFDELPPEVREFHAKAGLIPAILASTVTEAEAEKRILLFVQKFVTPKSSPLCGNSIYNDRMFLKARMPAMHDQLHYRMIDVSSIKELAKRWRPDLYEEVAKMKANKTHHALDDIRGSIEELKFYRDRWLK